MFSEAATSKLLVQALDKLYKGAYGDKLSYEVKICTLIEEHLEPIFCVYPNTGKNKREEQEMICQIFNFVDVAGGKEGLTSESKSFLLPNVIRSRENSQN